MNAALGVASLVVGALCAVYSIGAILFGSARPHRISWCAWTIVACLGSAATFSAGAGWGSLAAARTAVTAAIIFGLSLVPRYGKPDAERRSDVVLGFIALVATRFAAPGSLRLRSPRSERAHSRYCHGAGGVPPYFPQYLHLRYRAPAVVAGAQAWRPR